MLEAATEVIDGAIEAAVAQRIQGFADAIEVLEERFGGRNLLEDPEFLAQSMAPAEPQLELEIEPDGEGYGEFGTPIARTE